MVGIKKKQLKFYFFLFFWGERQIRNKKCLFWQQDWGFTPRAQDLVKPKPANMESLPIRASHEQLEEILVWCHSRTVLQQSVQTKVLLLKIHENGYFWAQNLSVIQGIYQLCDQRQRKIVRANCSNNIVRTITKNWG